MATHARRLLAARRDARDLVDVGAYVPGSNPVTDAALAAGPHLDAFLQQEVEERADAGRSWDQLSRIAGAHPVAEPAVTLG